MDHERFQQLSKWMLTANQLQEEGVPGNSGNNPGLGEENVMICHRDLLASWQISIVARLLRSSLAVSVGMRFVRSGFPTSFSRGLHIYPTTLQLPML